MLTGRKAPSNSNSSRSFSTAFVSCPASYDHPIRDQSTVCSHGRDRRRRVDLDGGQLLGDLDHVARASRIEQVCTHDDAARLIAREFVRHVRFRDSGRRCVRVKGLEHVLLDRLSASS